MSTYTHVTLDHVVATEFDEGEGVLVDLNTKSYYQLNETAMIVWRGLEKGMSIADLINEMTAHYEVTADQARASIERCLEELMARNLIARVS